MGTDRSVRASGFVSDRRVAHRDRVVCPHFHSRERGGALLAVLWLSAALAAIAFSVATTVRSETDRVSSASDGLRASYLASGAVERAIQWIEWGPTAHNPDGSPKYQYNQPRMLMQFPSGDAVVELIPEAAKLNINTASPDDLLRVVTAVTGDPRAIPRNRCRHYRLAHPRGRADGLRSVLFRRHSDFSRPARVL